MSGRPRTIRTLQPTRPAPIARSQTQTETHWPSIGISLGRGGTLAEFPFLGARQRDGSSLRDALSTCPTCPCLLHRPQVHPWRSEMLTAQGDPSGEVSRGKICQYSQASSSSPEAVGIRTVVRGGTAALSFKFVIVGPSLLSRRPLLGHSLIPREAGVQLLADRRRDAAVDAKRSTISG